MEVENVFFTVLDLPVGGSLQAPGAAANLGDAVVVIEGTSSVAYWVPESSRAADPWLRAVSLHYRHLSEARLQLTVGAVSTSVLFSGAHPPQCRHRLTAGASVPFGVGMPRRFRLFKWKLLWSWVQEHLYATQEFMSRPVGVHVGRWHYYLRCLLM